MIRHLCSPDKIVFDEVRGEYICIETGEVIEEHRVDLSRETRVYAHEEWIERSRTGPVLTHKVHDSGLTTTIDSRGIIGRKLSALHKRLRVSNRERKLVEALALMNDVTSKLNLPEYVKEEAGRIIKTLFNKGLLKKNKLAIFVAVAIHQACKIYGVPMRIQDILTYVGGTKEEFWSAKMQMATKLGRIIPEATIDPSAFIPKIITKLKLPPSVAALASRIIASLKLKGVTEGKDPVGLAAASVYVASILLNNKRTQRDIARAAGITEPTIRSRYRDIIENLMIVVHL